MKCDVFSRIHRYCKNVLTVVITTRNELENDDLENDDLENDDLENDDLKNDDLENDDLEHDDLENDDLENDDRDGVARRIKRPSRGVQKRTIGGNYEGVRGGRRRKITEK